METLDRQILTIELNLIAVTLGMGKACPSPPNLHHVGSSNPPSTICLKYVRHRLRAESSLPTQMTSSHHSQHRSSNQLRGINLAVQRLQARIGTRDLRELGSGRCAS